MYVISVICISRVHTIFFWKCNHVQAFWNNLNNFLINTHIQIQANFQIVSFGFCQQSEEDKLKNYIIFYAKYFIFLSKCHKTIPKCDNFKSYLRKRIEIEKEIALMNDKLHIFEAKWRQFITYL